MKTKCYEMSNKLTHAFNQNTYGTILSGKYFGLFIFFLIATNKTIKKDWETGK